MPTRKPELVRTSEASIANFLLSHPVRPPNNPGDFIVIEWRGQQLIWPVVDGARRFR